MSRCTQEAGRCSVWWIRNERGYGAGLGGCFAPLARIRGTEGEETDICPQWQKSSCAARVLVGCMGGERGHSLSSAPASPLPSLPLGISLAQGACLVFGREETWGATSGLLLLLLGWISLSLLLPAICLTSSSCSLWVIWSGKGAPALISSSEGLHLGILGVTLQPERPSGLGKSPGTIKPA